MCVYKDTDSLTKVTASLSGNALVYLDDYVLTGKPSRYNNQLQVNSAFHPSGWGDRGSAFALVLLI